jgi:hypothetical protein
MKIGARDRTGRARIGTGKRNEARTAAGSGGPSALRQKPYDQHDYNDNSNVINGRHGVAAAVLAASIEYLIRKCSRAIGPGGIDEPVWSMITGCASELYAV